MSFTELPTSHPLLPLLSPNPIANLQVFYPDDEGGGQWWQGEVVADELEAVEVEKYDSDGLLHDQVLQLPSWERFTVAWTDQVVPLFPDSASMLNLSVISCILLVVSDHVQRCRSSTGGLCFEVRRLLANLPCHGAFCAEVGGRL